MSLGSLVVSLNANIAKFESAMNRAQYVANQNMGRISRDVSGMKASFDAVPGAIGKVVTAAAALTGIAYVFKKAISATDEFRVSVIGIAAGLTNIAKPGQGDFGSIFKRNLEFAKQMAVELERVAAKQFAEPAEMMMAYNQLVQQGYAVRLNEVDALGIVVDRIKLATQGQDANRQINQEIRALMQGQAVAGSMIALELQSRLGPAWADIVNQHRQAGDLLKFLASLWPGMAAATDEVQNTLMAQGSTLQGHLKYLGREGLGGAYDEIVAFTRQINEYLRDHGKELAGNIATGWAALKDVAGGTLAVVKGIYDWLAWAATPVTFLVNKLNEIAKSTPGVLEGMMGETGQTGGAGLVKERRLTIPPPKAAAIAGPPPAVSPPTPGGGKGGKGIESAQNRLENFIQQMKQLSAKAAGESFTALEEWYKKETLAIQRLEEKLGTSYEAREALDAAYQYKRKALIDKFSESEIKTFQEYAEKQEKVWLDSLNLQQSQFDSLAQLSPLLQDQLVFKQKALDLEIQINQATFEKKLMEMEKAHIVSKAQADEMRGMHALQNQLKRSNNEWSKIEKHVHLFDNIFSSIGSNFSNLITGIVSGSMTIVEGIAGIFQSVADSILNVIMTMVANWVMAQAMIMGLNYAASIGLITNEAAVAGAKAYSAYADIPFIGLALGAAAAAAVMGIMLAFQGNLKSSAGGDYRVAETGLRMVHKDETVLPGWAAEGWRSIVSGGKSSRPGENGSPVVIENLVYAPAYRASEADRRRDLKAFWEATEKQFGKAGKKFMPGRI